MTTLGNCYLCNSKTVTFYLHFFSVGCARHRQQDIRFAETMNRRVQDGEKKRWLCSSCEGILGENERQFASSFFHPFVEGRLTHRKYGSWLLKFCVSLSWRALHFLLESNAMKNILGMSVNLSLKLGRSGRNTSSVAVHIQAVFANTCSL